MTSIGGEEIALRTRIYIDGYNLYYGCLKGTAYKWLDLLALFERQVLPSILFERSGLVATSQLLPVSIKYFTADILMRAAKSPDSVSSQSRYHTALKRHLGDRIEIIKGYYSMTESKAKAIDPSNKSVDPKDCNETLVWKLEEKQTDVNLALHLYHDAFAGEVDHVIVVTNDTDIAPALKMIRDNTDVSIGLVVPTRDNARMPNTVLKDQAHWTRRSLTDMELANSQLPRVIPGRRRATIKPDSW